MARPPGTRRPKLHPTTDAPPSTLPLMTRENFDKASRLFSDGDYLVGLLDGLLSAGGMELAFEVTNAAGTRTWRTNSINREILAAGLEHCLNRIDSDLRRLGVCPIVTLTDDIDPFRDSPPPPLQAPGADEGAATADPSAPHPSWEGSDQPAADPGAGDADAAVAAAAATTDPAAATTDPGAVAA